MFMVCLNCRKELPEDALFCPECGKPIKNGSSSSRETKSNNNAPRETDNLRSFEQASQIRCPKCGAYGCRPNNREWTCVACGHTFRLRKDVYRSIELLSYFSYVAFVFLAFFMGVTVASVIQGASFLPSDMSFLGLCGMCAVWVWFIFQLPKKYNGSTLKEFLSSKEKQKLANKTKVVGIIATAIFFLPILLSLIVG